MTDEEKLLTMFSCVYGDLPGFHTEFECDDGNEVTGINVMKDGCLSWSISKTDLLFEYVTKDWSSEA